MQLTDTEALRALLRALYPTLKISDVAKPSGQRVVYYAAFEGKDEIGRNELGPIVVKVSQGITAQSIAYLQKEILVLNSIESDNFPKLYFHDVVSTDPVSEEALEYRLFITVEEYIDSQSLAECANLFADEKSCFELLKKLVFALCSIWQHELRLVHRDLKPDNILIKEDGEIAIIDLGIIREEGAEGITLSAAPFGPCTPLYASPEQAANDKRNITFKSDLFSIGTLIYELILGENPFEKDSGGLIDNILHNVITLEPPNLHVIGKCTREFADLIECMMAKQPYKRPRTIAFLKNEISKVEGAYFV